MSSDSSSKSPSVTVSTRLARPSRASLLAVGCIGVMILFGCLNSCINAPEFSIVPKIEFVGLTKDTMQQGLNQQDSITVTFHFEDGDGDIGRTTSAEMNNVFFIDTRTGQIDNTFGIPFIPQQGSTNGIEGDVHIKIYSTCCIYPQGDPCLPSIQFPVDELTYQIYITDRAGNSSNVIETTVIHLLCD